MFLTHTVKENKKSSAIIIFLPCVLGKVMIFSLQHRPTTIYCLHRVSGSNGKASFLDVHVTRMGRDASCQLLDICWQHRDEWWDVGIMGSFPSFTADESRCPVVLFYTVIECDGFPSSFCCRTVLQLLPVFILMFSTAGSFPPQLLPPHCLPIPFGLHRSSLSPAGDGCNPRRNVAHRPLQDLGMWPCKASDGECRAGKSNLMSPGSTGREELNVCGLFTGLGCPASFIRRKIEARLFGCMGYFPIHCVWVMYSLPVVLINIFHSYFLLQSPLG